MISKEKWRKHIKIDPYLDIEPSLLNSDHIFKYASKGCLVSDFDKKNLLPAGYKMSFLGDLIQWELEDYQDRSLWLPSKKRKYVRKTVKVEAGDHIMLKRNSIAYLHMHEEFRLPQYIAARFNLRITHVHQGLLLGTGPLVDPGFIGRILIPLHNLTDNDYAFVGGKSLIHVEFTKLSSLDRWTNGFDLESKPDKYEEFPKDKIEAEPDEYFKKAEVLANDGVVSYLGRALADAQEWNEKTRRAIRRLRTIGVVAVIALFVTVSSFVVAVHNFYQNSSRILERANDVAAQAESTANDAEALLKSYIRTPGGSNVGGPNVRGRSAVVTGSAVAVPPSGVPSPQVDGAPESGVGISNDKGANAVVSGSVEATPHAEGPTPHSDTSSQGEKKSTDEVAAKEDDPNSD